MSEHASPSAVDGSATTRIVVVTDNQIARAVTDIAAVVNIPTTLLADDDHGGPPLSWLTSHELRAADAVVLCDHDAPDALDTLRRALEGPAAYVAMTASRNRSGAVFAMLRAEGVAPSTLERLRMPAGLDIGGRSAGEIALSVVAEIVAVSHGRPGGPMRSTEPPA